MKHIKIICAIAAAALLTGCADEAVSSATTQTTAQTTTTAETTIQTTTAATTTTATTAETTVTEATTTTAEEVIVEPAETIPAIEDAKPPQESEKTPDGKYDLADTDLVNTDGTYTQTAFDVENIPVWAREDLSANRWSKMEGKYTSNPSKIPYSEITLENAAEAFPFLGYTGKYPNYIEILPTDDAETIARKVYENLIGESSTSYMGGSDLWQYHNFKSQAEYDAYLVEQERLAAESEAQGQQIAAGEQAIVNGEASIGGHTPDSVIEDLFSEYN